MMPVNENWILITQFAEKLQVNIAEEDFQEACQTKRWSVLEQAQTELADLAPFWETSLLCCTMTQGEKFLAKELIDILTT